jgi:glutamine synthetase type III
MPTEGKITVAVSVPDWNVDAKSAPKTAPHTFTGDNFNLRRQTVTTSAAALNVGGCVTPGLLWARNVSTSNNVKISRAADGSNAIAKLRPGGVPTLIPLESLTLYVVSDAGSPVIEYVVTDS